MGSFCCGSSGGSVTDNTTQTGDANDDHNAIAMEIKSEEQPEHPQEIKVAEQTATTNNSKVGESAANSSTTPAATRKKSVKNKTDRRGRAPTDITTTADRMRWIQIEQEIPFTNITAISVNLYQPLLYTYYPCPTFYKYNPRTYKFVEWCTVDVPNDNYHSQGAVCYDDVNELLYLLSADQVIKVDTSTKEHRCDMLHVAKIENSKKAVCIQGKLHMISDLKHYIFHEEQRTFVVACDFRSAHLLSNSSFFELLYVESQNKLLYISRDALLVYDVTDNKWKKSSHVTDLTSPINAYFSCSMTSDEKYALFIGDVGGRDNVYVLDLLEMRFLKSRVAIPKRTDPYSCKSMIIRNPYQEKLCVFGYVRMQYAQFATTDTNSSEKEIFPIAVMEVISHWYHMDFFYFISTRHGQHFRIQVDAIVRDLGSDSALSKKETTTNRAQALYARDQNAFRNMLQ